MKHICFNLLSAEIKLIILQLYDILTSNLRLYRPESCKYKLLYTYSMLQHAQRWRIGGFISMVVVIQIVIVGHLFGECNASCTLKTQYIHFEKEQARYSCYTCLNISSVPKFPYFSNGTQKSFSRLGTSSLISIQILYIVVPVLGVVNRTGCVIVSVPSTSVVDREFEPRLSQTKDYKIGICCFSTKHSALMGSKSKDWLAQNQDHVYDQSDVSTCILLFH